MYNGQLNQKDTSPAADSAICSFIKEKHIAVPSYRPQNRILLVCAIILFVLGTGTFLLWALPIEFEEQQAPMFMLYLGLISWLLD